jgi:hypothetical protein
MERILRLHKKDDTHIDLKIVKATAIRNGSGMFHLDKLKDGYRLIVSDDIIDDMTNFDTLEMIRKD